MPFCATCGAPVEGRFCAKCGSVVVAPGAGPSGSAEQPAAQPMARPPAVAGGMTDNVASALCYVLGLITGIIFLVIAPYNQNKRVRFHAFQSIFMHVAVIAIWFAMGIVFSIMFHIMHSLTLLGLVIYPVLGLAIFGLWVYLIVSAYQGRTVVLPIIGPLAEQQA